MFIFFKIYKSVVFYILKCFNIQMLKKKTMLKMKYVILMYCWDIIKNDNNSKYEHRMENTWENDKVLICMHTLILLRRILILGD